MTDTQGTNMVVSEGGVDDSVSSLEENEQKTSPFSILSNTDVLRQVTLILALAICLAMAVFILLWGKEPEYRPLGTMQTEELIQTLDFLDQQKIPYKVEGNTVLVIAENYQDIKLKMTRSGMAQPELEGDDILMTDMGFGVSQQVERERLKLGRERQLARAIEEFKKDF